MGHRGASLPIVFFLRVNLSIFCSELMLLDGNFSGKFDEFFSRGVCSWKMHFHRNVL